MPSFVHSQWVFSIVVVCAFSIPCIPAQHALPFMHQEKTNQQMVAIEVVTKPQQQSGPPPFLLSHSPVSTPHSRANDPCPRFALYSGVTTPLMSMLTLM
ncbi:MAG: hypothetical protein JOS17DRAFT_742806 [Linnemannia elongata]|nr:MAG: hypothetical protein JOS17DRAFT_742806 [Linnemannia elongata]